MDKPETSLIQRRVCWAARRIVAAKGAAESPDETRHLVEDEAHEAYFVALVHVLDDRPGLIAEFRDLALPDDFAHGADRFSLLIGDGDLQVQDGPVFQGGD